MTNVRTQRAMTLMRNYAQRTGLTSGQPRKRYLWTDAFAVCNYLELARTTGDSAYKELTLKLINQVHHLLGQYRQDDTRTGWIIGMKKQASEMHPTRCGLRIGKPLPERGLNETFNTQLEWDRDGQYFHYLSKWMHALDQVARATGQNRFNLWARELAATAFNAFTYSPSSSIHEPRRMVWKMSIDLSRAQVASMGQHDPLDGYITMLQLASTAAIQSNSDSEPKLDKETTEFAHMLENSDWSTDDPLGIGGLLVDAYRLQQLQQQGVNYRPRLLEQLLDAAVTGLQYYKRSGELQQPAQYRLAFRELGLTIGLHAVERMQQSLYRTADDAKNKRLREQLNTLKQYNGIRDYIEHFWLEAKHQQTKTWLEHQDINEVMLATSLIPDGFLELQPTRGK